MEFKEDVSVYVCVCGKVIYLCVVLQRNRIQQRYLAIILVGISQYKASHNLTLILAIFIILLK